MKRAKSAHVLLLFTILLTSCSTCSFSSPGSIVQSVSPETVKIASFNMQIFGETKLGRPNLMNVLAQLACGFDIIALQEVGTNKPVVSDDTCEHVMQVYTAKINKLAGTAEYSFVRGNQYAFVYRTDKFEVVGHALYNGTKHFAYTPLAAFFRTIMPGSNFDFAIITIHTSPDLAGSEITFLKTAVDEIKEFYDEPDIICLGDFNADGTYYNEGTEEWLAGFDPAIYISGIPNSADTTVAASSNTYDRIQMTSSCSTDFTGTYGVVKFSDVFDVSVCEGGTTTQGTEKAVSDHYPVWCEFYTDRDED